MRSLHERLKIGAPRVQHDALGVRCDALGPAALRRVARRHARLGQRQLQRLVGDGARSPPVQRLQQPQRTLRSGACCIDFRHQIGPEFRFRHTGINQIQGQESFHLILELFFHSGPRCQLSAPIAEAQEERIRRLTVVGDFDEKAISTLTQELFGNWKSPQPFTRIKQEYRAIAPINKSFETPDKANAFFIARLNVKIRDDNADYAALTLGNYMLGGGFLNSRLAARIRGRDGLSYGVGSRFNASSLDESGTFLANAIYAPENAEKLEAAFKDELAKLQKDGFTAEEVEAAKSGWLQSRQLSRAQDRELSGTINNYLFLNRTLAFDADFENKIKALTPEQINAAMRKYMTAENITIIKAGDFAKAKDKMMKPVQ